jgi:hypothetical protein
VLLLLLLLLLLPPLLAHSSNRAPVEGRMSVLTSSCTDVWANNGLCSGGAYGSQVYFVPGGRSGALIRYCWAVVVLPVVLLKISKIEKKG